MDKEKDLKNISNLLTAILLLLLEEKNQREEKDNCKGQKVEVLLVAAGLTASDISSLIGKNLEAVKKAIQRGRK
jgi:hypothetical protein